MLALATARRCGPRGTGEGKWRSFRVVGTGSENTRGLSSSSADSRAHARARTDSGDPDGPSVTGLMRGRPGRGPDTGARMVRTGDAGWVNRGETSAGGKAAVAAVARVRRPSLG
jgi:hypothetical protein